MAFSKLQKELINTAKYLVVRGKGILPVDEPTGSFFKESEAVADTPENRRRHLEILFTSDCSLGNCISGVIFLEQTFVEKTKDGTPFLKLLDHLNILPGIKLDLGITDLAGSQGEKTTKGLDDLPERCRMYKVMGAKFAKWRCVFKIGEQTPSQLAIETNTTLLARYAIICQQNGLVPIVEPEVLCDGDHDLERAKLTSIKVLSAQVKALLDHGVLLEGMLLKCSMIRPGHACETVCTPEQVAEATIEVLTRTIPPAIPGITFLSGGLSEIDATTYLNSINKHPGVNKPWSLTFTFGRALQATVMKIWGGKDEKVAAAQQEFIKRVKANSKASLGNYSSKDEGNGEDDDARKSLFNPEHSY
ncbi:fructose-bisphosphate aldolase A isoform X2 [Patella vulgata]|uniref:fructose-bisphosphate aldolase A isoform X2 n=1 Tax=Patella vulgata TaxID=6465 RepID=UPI00217F51DA|nr:fructose-bisphosphate aldolase A isoform X2 [Patella vulgata]